MTLGGQLVTSFSSGKREGGDFVGCCTSAQARAPLLAALRPSAPFLHLAAVARRAHPAPTSAQGGWVHGIAEDAHLYSFEVKEGKLQHLLKAHDKDPIGVAIHPHRNLVASWSDDGTLKLWRGA
jgi:WD40 repeat-containing protein SMU1